MCWRELYTCTSGHGGCLSRLADVSVTETIRQAIEARLQAMAADPELSTKAATLAAEIEREAAEQREALVGLFPPEASARPQRAKSA